MKYLYIEQLYFRLPDDFKGSKDDAFALADEYIQSHKTIHAHDEQEGTPVDLFNALFPHDEQKMSYGIGTFELKDGISVPLEASE